MSAGEKASYARAVVTVDCIVSIGTSKDNN
jgi:hypothetical protein